MSVTLSLSLYPPALTLQHWMLLYRICQPGGVPHGSDARWMGGPLSSGGILFDPTLILPSLSILPRPRSYRFGIYRAPTYPSYHALSSPICRGTRWVILILPALYILQCPRSYRIVAYPNPTYSTYHTVSYRRPTGGESCGSDNRLAE